MNKNKKKWSSQVLSMGVEHNLIQRLLISFILKIRSEPLNARSDDLDSAHNTQVHNMAPAFGNQSPSLIYCSFILLQNLGHGGGESVQRSPQSWTTRSSDSQSAQSLDSQYSL